MAVSLPYENARDLTYAVKDETADLKMTAFPYNRFRPQQSDWWLSPQSENPAYRHGKFVFDPDIDAETPQVFVGVHIERGFGQAVAEVSASARDRRQVMEPDWFWHQFSDHMASGTAQQVLAGIAEQVDEPVTATFHAAFWSDPTSDFDPYSGSEDGGSDTACFTVDGDQLRLAADASKTPLGLLDDVMACDRLDQVAKRLAVLPNTDWVWIGAYLGIQCGLGASAPGAVAWDAATLWERVLKSFWPWFR